MSERVTSIDVAREAGVSQSAVSRVFSEHGSASAQTVQKVHHAAAKFGYRPNILARSLITGKSRIIGVIVAYLENSSIQRHLKNYHLLFRRRDITYLSFWRLIARMTLIALSLKS